MLLENKYQYKYRFELPPQEEIDRMAFEDKVSIFKTSLHKLKVDWRTGAEHLDINRDDIINLSINQFNAIDPYRELKINFNGEVNLDAGGLIRE